MLFTSPIFLFLFLPLVILCFQLVPKKLHALYLIMASLIFYSWPSLLTGLSIVLIVFSNWSIVWTFKYPRLKRGMFIVGILYNLTFLCYYKYFSPNFPLGFSFFTFHSISYLIDSYRQNSRSHSLLNTGLYLLFFPHISAGPISKFRDFSKQIEKSPKQIMDNLGVERFILGLGEKMLLANTFAGIADQVFKLSSATLSQPLAWIGILAYTLQIYFDFAGYSNMAIGLGNLFGFQLPENFNLPYRSSSITEFWSRWHISLTSWLREYLYFPLGGSRLGEFRTYQNILTVFIFSGLWHGTGFNFLIWGIWHGSFMVIEKWLSNHQIHLVRNWKILGWLYTMLVVMFGWVMFRSRSINDSLTYLKVMFGFGSQLGSNIHWLSIFTPYVLLASLLGIFLSTGIIRPGKIWVIIRVPLLSLIFGLSLLAVAGNTYTSFIYFKF